MKKTTKLPRPISLEIAKLSVSSYKQRMVHLINLEDRLNKYDEIISELDSINSQDENIIIWRDGQRKHFTHVYFQIVFAIELLRRERSSPRIVIQMANHIEKQTQYSISPFRLSKLVLPIAQLKFELSEDVSWPMISVLLSDSLTTEQLEYFYPITRREMNIA